MPPEYPIGMSRTSYYFMVADVHIGSVSIGSRQSGSGIKVEL